MHRRVREDRGRQDTAAAGGRPRTRTEPSELLRLQQAAGNRAVGDLLEPRPIQRDDDEPGLLDSVVSGASDLGSAAYSGYETNTKDTSNLISKGLDAYGKGAENQENAVHDQLYGAADAVSGVPLLGSLAQATAWGLDKSNKVVGGVGEGVVDLAGGAVRGAVDPVSAAKGLYGMGSRLPIGVALGAGADAASDLSDGNYSKAGDDLLNAPGKALDNIFGGLGETGPSAPKDAGILRGLLNPFYQDASKGRGAHAVGRGIADVGAVLLGGEAMGGEVAGGELAAGSEVAAGEGLGAGAAETAAAEGGEAALGEGASAAPETVPNPAIEPVPDTIPDGVPQKPNWLEDPGLKQPQPYRGPEPNELPAPDDPELPMVKTQPMPEVAPDTIPEPEPPTLPGARPISPAAESVPAPGAGPASAPISSAPATPNPGGIVDDFEQAWKDFSDVPFEYRHLPGHT